MSDPQPPWQVAQAHDQATRLHAGMQGVEIEPATLRIDPGAPYRGGALAWLIEGSDSATPVVVSRCTRLPTGGWSIEVDHSEGWSVALGFDSVGQPFGSAWLKPRDGEGG